MALRVMIVSTPFIPALPPTYGGLERVVFDLAAGLRELRLDAAVACPSESKLPRGVEHINVDPSKYSVQQNWVEADDEAYDQSGPRLRDFEMIHDHSWYGRPYIAKKKMLLQLWGRFPLIPVDAHVVCTSRVKCDHDDLASILTIFRQPYPTDYCLATCAYIVFATRTLPFSTGPRPVLREGQD